MDPLHQVSGSSDQNAGCPGFFDGFRFQRAVLPKEFVGREPEIRLARG
jgi:hypothetical protein